MKVGRIQSRQNTRGTKNASAKNVHLSFTFFMMMMMIFRLEKVKRLSRSFRKTYIINCIRGVELPTNYTVLKRVDDALSGLANSSVDHRRWRRSVKEEEKKSVQFFDSSRRETDRRRWQKTEGRRSSDHRHAAADIDDDIRDRRRGKREREIPIRGKYSLFYKVQLHFLVSCFSRMFGNKRLFFQPKRSKKKSANNQYANNRSR